MQVLEKIYLVQFNEALTLPVNEALTLLGRVELDVRLALRSRHSQRSRTRPPSAMKRLMHRSDFNNYSVTSCARFWPK